MKRIAFLIVLLVVMLVLILIGYFIPYLRPSQPAANLTGELATLSSLSPNSNIKTVAICNESNFCQDYRIVCSEGEIVEKTPVPGAFIQHPENWTDDRDIDYENLCK